jgi:SNF2 family DNA or RNA helicase
MIPQLSILGKLDDLFGSTSAFRVRFCNLTLRRIGKRRVWDDSGRSNLPELNQRLAPIMLRRLKRDVLKDLPDKTYARVVVELSNRDEYQQYEDAIADADPGQRAAMTAKMRGIMAQGKIEPAIEWVESFMDSTDGEKLIVFAYHRSVQQALVAAFPDCARIFASADMQKLKLDVEAEKQRFQEDPNCRLIICSMMAAGFGHTLTAASNLLNVELDYTPGVMQQCEDRLHRPGQQYPCTIWTLVAEDSVDDRLTELLVEKRQVTGVVLDGAEQVLDEQTVSRAVVAEILKRVNQRKRKAA